MIQNRDLPILIIGQGIAGTVLAHQAVKRSIPFRIMDDGHLSSSSHAAAGLYNAFNLKRRKLSWRANDFMPDSRIFFKAIGKTIGGEVDKEIGIFRRIHDIEEYNDWTAKEDISKMGPFLGKAYSAESICQEIPAPYGYREVKESGYVEIARFLALSKEIFIKEGRYTKGVFREEACDLSEDLRYGGEAYAAIIICTGYKSWASQRFFPDLPFTPAKGHTLTIRCPGLQLTRIISGPCFVIPCGGDEFVIGSTYSWDPLDESIEPDEVEKLLQRFRSFCPLPFSVLEARAGVRPATKDQKPFIGSGRIDSRVFIFGGLGSRAVMTSPLLADQLLDHICTGSMCWEEVALERVYAK